jgi:prepilin-type N-terminal cleavage/methylation domain-containing protein
MQDGMVFYRCSPARARRGMSLLEVMVVIVIMLGMITVAVPTIGSLFSLQQRKVAKDLVLVYQRLHDEAILRNVSFRIGFDLEGNSYSIDTGEPGTLIFDNPEDRESWEEMRDARFALMTSEELEKHEAARRPFEKLSEGLSETRKLPGGIRFGGVYTPQYPEMMRPEAYGGDELKSFNAEGEEIPGKVFSYVFPNGMSEHTVIWIVTEDDPKDGYTIEIEPLSGKIQLHGELLDWEDSYDFVPDEGPDLPA